MIDPNEEREGEERAQAAGRGDDTRRKSARETEHISITRGLVQQHVIRHVVSKMIPADRVWRPSGHGGAYPNSFVNLF